MITRIFTVILTLIILPISLVFGVFRGVVVALKGRAGSHFVNEI